MIPLVSRRRSSEHRHPATAASFLIRRTIAHIGHGTDAMLLAATGIQFLVELKDEEARVSANGLRIVVLKVDVNWDGASLLFFSKSVTH